MFCCDKYITRGINDTLDRNIILTMWQMIDELKKKIPTVDYLQVFRLEPEGDNLIISHSQECPEFEQQKVLRLHESYKPDFEEIKVFAIDSESYATMMLAEEY